MKANSAIRLKSLIFLPIASSSPMPFPWVKKVEVTDDLSVNIFPTECSSNPFQELQVNDWSRTSSGNTQTFTSGSDSLTLTKQSGPASGAKGTFGLKLIDQDGDEHLISGMLLFLFFWIHSKLYEYFPLRSELETFYTV